MFLYNKILNTLGLAKKIKAFIITFNEASTIGFTIRHYRRFCTEIYIFDNYSTDNTREICQTLGCKVEIFGTKGVLDDRAYLEIKNKVWQQHRDSDYVIVCDADEIINKPAKLNKHLYQSIGYDMYSEQMPIHSWQEIRYGQPNADYNKVVLFNPKVVREINYEFGCHSINPVFYTENIQTDSSSVILKHMRYVGGVQRLIDRYNLYTQRLCDFNKEMQFGHQYLMKTEEIKQKWGIVKQASVELEDL